MSAQELEVLLHAVAVNSDRAAFKKLYFFYYRRLFCLATSFTRRAEEAEEIVDDTFMRIWLKRDELQHIRNFTAYICTAVRNKSLNEVARIKMHQHITLDDVEIELHDIAPDACQKLQLDDLNKNLALCIDKLPSQCKLVFKLVKEDGFKYREVAEMLDISVKTVEYHMGNALKRIWDSLAESNDQASVKML